ncbi:MAG: FapA family protein [Clostridiales bacterium]|jgi:uncharacterized protein (DUF342 family)|nr:FapA family protein [Clostridiales bacterium]
MGSPKNVSLKIKEDGVYLLINRAEGEKVTRGDVLSVVESNFIKDIDFVAVNSIFKSDDLFFETLISRNTDVLVKKESARVTVEANRMSASVTFIEPLNSSDLMEFEDFKNILREQKIEYGFEEENLRDIFSKRVYNMPFVIAKGLEPIDGINGYIQRHFTLKEKNFRPKHLDDGTVDFKQLDIIDIVKEGTLLLEQIPAIPGVDGMNVLGKTIAHKVCKPAPSIPKTKNTRLSEDGSKLFAGLSGQIVVNENKVEIFPVLQISKDVDNSVGNVDFVGSVSINGNVLTGFTVKAEGSIEVHGVLEGGELIAGGDIVLTGGAQGVEKASIKARGNIHAKYIDQCTVYAGGDIYTDFIVYSRVKCGGSVELSGKKGLLLGGSVSAKNQIIADVIGANLSASTEIELGFEPDDFERYKGLLNQMEEAQEEYNKLLQKENILSQQAKRSKRPEEMDLIQTNKEYTKQYYENRIEELQNQIAALTSMENPEEVYIHVNKVIHAGVKVVITNAQTYILERQKACKILNIGGRIKSISLDEVSAS